MIDVYTLQGRKKFLMDFEDKFVTVFLVGDMLLKCNKCILIRNAILCFFYRSGIIDLYLLPLVFHTLALGRMMLSKMHQFFCLKCFLHVTGNKVNNIDVVYTPWYNLKKTPSMDVGQVGFHNPKMVSIVFCLL